MNVAPLPVIPVTYDRAEVLQFEDGTEGKHCSQEVCLSGGNLPQPAKSYVKSWQDMNPSIVGVKFVYMNPRCSNFVRS